MVCYNYYMWGNMNIRYMNIYIYIHTSKCIDHLWVHKKLVTWIASKESTREWGAREGIRLPSYHTTFSTV